jgi:hypothetical protein
VLSDYDIYISNNLIGNRSFLKYNTLDQTISDSIPYPTLWRDADVSANGEHLMFTTSVSPFDTFVVYDIQTMERVNTQLGEGYIEVSNTGAYIALLDDEGLTFLDGNTYDVLFSDPINCDFGGFVKDGSKFFTITDNNHIRIYDMIGETLFDDIEYIYRSYPTYVYKIQPSPTGEKAFMIISLAASQDKFLVSYHFDADSTGLFYPLAPGAGHMAITPDEKQLIVTDHSDAVGLPATQQIIFFDAETERVNRILSAGYSIPDQSFFGFDPGHICITPDSRYALITPAGWGPMHVFALVDIVNHEFVDIVFEPAENRFYTSAHCKKIQ